MSLHGAAKRHLRALGHPLEPVVQVGKSGVTEGLVEAVRQALADHELVKVRVSTEAPLDRKAAAEAVAAAAGAELAEVKGRTFLLYKRRPKDPKIVLPNAPKSPA